MYFEIYAKISFLTFDLDPRSEVMAPNESAYMIYYISVRQMESLTLVLCMLFEETCLFDLSRSSEVKGHGQISTKKMINTSLGYKQFIYKIF